MKRLWEYMMMEPRADNELPAGAIRCEVYKDERGIFGWGKVIYDRPLTGKEIDKYNLDGPLTAWG